MKKLIYERTSKKPEFIEEDYITRYNEPCSYIRELGKYWYKGTGILIEDHPLQKFINMRGCANCKSENVLVIAAQRSVHPMNGDVYWDYEIRCKDCGMYTQRSFSENE